LRMTSAICCVVIPSIPGEPLLLLTALVAFSILQSSSALSIVAIYSAWTLGRIDVPLPVSVSIVLFKGGMRLSLSSFVLASGCPSFLRLSVTIKVRLFLRSHVRTFGVKKRLLRRLLTAVPFTSSLRDTASAVVPLFCRVFVRHEYSSHRVIR